MAMLPSLLPNSESWPARESYLVAREERPFQSESKLRRADDCDQHSEQQKPKPPEQKAEIVSDGG